MKLPKCPKCGMILEVKEIQEVDTKSIKYICLGCKSHFKRDVKKTDAGFIYNPVISPLKNGKDNK